MEQFCGSEFWNSNRPWYMNKPIFTKCFRDITLVWMPCLLYWLLLPIDLYYIVRNRHKFKTIPWNRINISKLIANCLLLMLCTSDLIVAIIFSDDINRIQASYYIYPVDIWTPIIKLATFVLIFIVMLLNRYRGIHTSGCQFLFWLALLLCSICRIMGSSDAVDKDIFWSKYRYTSFIINFGLIITLFILNCYADKRHSDDDHRQGKNPLPECSAGFLSRITYYWFDKLAWKGYRNPLTAQDLWELPPTESTKDIMQNFNYHWNNVNRKNVDDKRSGKKICIMPPIIKSFAGIFLFGSLMKLLTDILTFVHPQILRAIIGYVESRAHITQTQTQTHTNSTEFDIDFELESEREFESESQPEWLGVSYAILLFLTTSIQTVVLCQYFHRMFIVGLRIRSAIISTIYRKALVISNVARRKNYTTGEIVNLMAVDAQRFMDLTNYLNMIWSAPLQIALALYFLWQQLGPSVLAGLAIMIILIPINAAIAGRMKSLQYKQMQCKDERVKLMNELLMGIKVIKLNAWEKNFEKQVLAMRDKELATIMASSYLNATTVLLMFCASFMVSLATFATYVLIDDRHVLDATKTFVSLSLFNILSFPLNTFPILITNIVQAQVSVKRINKYLNSPELDPDSVEHEPNDTYSILIENGNFTWNDSSCAADSSGDFAVIDSPDDHSFQLKNINIKVKRQTLIAITGPVGSGKSSLIQAILGEMTRLSSGRVNVDGSIAYVPQQAWIRNATVRENILFDRPYKKKRYKRIIDACALQSDIETFISGDSTEIGERGINLSGGQKQRISLARAIYSDADIYLLDDPLSAVDAHVRRHIFENVIGENGLLGSKTRLLVTHSSIALLKELDYIYVLKSGHIHESGTYANLIESMNKMHVADADADVNGDADGNTDGDGDGDGNNDADCNGDGNSHAAAAAVVVVDGSFATFGKSREKHMQKHIQEVNEIRKNSIISNDDSIMEAIFTQGDNSDGKLIEDEIVKLENVRFAVYWHYIRHVGIFLSMMSLLLILFFQIFQIASNLWLARWSNDDRLISDSSVRDMYLSVYGAFGLMQAIASFLAMLALSVGCLHCSRKLHTTLLWNVLRWPMPLFDITPAGRILNRFSKDVDVVDNTLPQNCRMILMQAYALIATIVVISISTPMFLATILPIAVIYILVQRIYVVTSRQLMRLVSVSRSPIYSHFGETLAGVTSIRAYGVKERFIDISDMRVDYNHACQYPALIANRWLSVRLEMIGNFIIFFASIFAILSDQSNTGMVGLTISYALQITDTLKWLVRLSSDVENNIVAVERIREYSDIEQEAQQQHCNCCDSDCDCNVFDCDCDEPKPTCNKPCQQRCQQQLPTLNWPKTGNIIFENFHVRYRDELDLVLKGVSFSVGDGEKVAIVGRTGAGKSSLALALFRIIESAGGRILIDGVDIAELNLQQLRSRLTIMPQDPVLFSGSLRSNIDPLAVKSDTEIWRALELSHLKEFVKSLPMALNFQISECGENLSIGQRQLVCLARAILRKSKILVLDEATAAIDMKTDALIQQTIRSEFKECTVLTIAHRLNTILDYDKVIVLDRGKVVEYGRVADLLSNSKSMFHAMAKDANIIDN